MAKLYLAEFAAIGGSGNFPVQAALVPPIAEQTVSITGSSTASAAFNVNTKFVRINVDAICSIAFGVTPTASTTTGRMAANQTEYFPVIAGQKVAVITNS